MVVKKFFLRTRPLIYLVFVKQYLHEMGRCSTGIILLKVNKIALCSAVETRRIILINKANARYSSYKCTVNYHIKYIQHRAAHIGAVHMALRASDSHMISSPFIASFWMIFHLILLCPGSVDLTVLLCLLFLPFEG